MSQERLCAGSMLFLPVSAFYDCCTLALGQLIAACCAHERERLLEQCERSSMLIRKFYGWRLGRAGQPCWYSCVRAAAPFWKGRPVCEVFVYDMEHVDGSIQPEQVYGLVRRKYRLTKI